MRTFSKSNRIDDPVMEDKLFTIINQQAGQSTQEIAKQFGCSPRSAAFKTLMKRLEWAGLIARTTDLVDARRSAWMVTI